MHLHPGLAVDVYPSGSNIAEHGVIADVLNDHCVHVSCLRRNGNWSPFNSLFFVYPGEIVPATSSFATLKGANAVRQEPTPPAQPVPVAEAALETPSPEQPEPQDQSVSKTEAPAPATA